MSLKKTDEIVITDSEKEFLQTETMYNGSFQEEKSLGYRDVQKMMNGTEVVLLMRITYGD